MKNCPNCRAQAKDEALFCPVCGTMLDVVPQLSVEYFQPEPQQIPVSMPVTAVHDVFDHTSDYAADDIRENKLPSMAAYLLDFIGVIIALLMCPSSAYGRFHIRQALKFIILEALITAVSLLLCWTFIVPILGIVALLVLIILKTVCFVDVCKGRAKDAVLLRKIKFLN